MWKLLVVTFLWVTLVRGMVDLFQTKVNSFRNGVLQEVGCESLILENFNKRKGTGVKVSYQTGRKDRILKTGSQ